MPTTAAETIWDATLAEIASLPQPDSTYRMQFHSGFTLDDARQWVSYLRALGITTCYASPLLRATEGSTSGYDTCNHAELNPELGGQEAFDRLAADLQTQGMGLLIDIVPNHMGIATNQNAWWQDVLENGRSSIYAHYFDIEWEPLKPDLHDKVLLPILGDQFGRILEAGELRLEYDAGSFYVAYYQRRFPIAPRSSIMILEHRLPELQAKLDADNPHVMELQSIITGLTHLPERSESDPERIAERYREKEVLKRRLNTLTAISPEVAAHVDENVRNFNGRAGDLRSFDLLESLLEQQAYRLAYWRVAADEINYRRFFDINELAAITPENLDVFAETHALILHLIDERKAIGVRVDHPDGLFDPPEYFRRLQQERFLQVARRQYDAMQSADASIETNGADVDSAASAATASVGAIGSAVQARGRTSLAEGRAPATTPTWETLLPQLRARYHLEIEPHASEPAARPLYVVAEKILSRGESLPADWAVAGTTGYDFLTLVNGLFVDAANEREVTRIYQRFTNLRDSFSELAYLSRKLVMQAAMSSELSMLGFQLDRLSEKNRYSRDFTLNSLTAALREIVACFPVYRTYADCNSPTAHVTDRDRHYIETAVQRARRRNPNVSGSIFEFVGRVLLLTPLESGAEYASAEQRHFVGRFQQFSSPVMAKGVEDTAFYRYNRLVSLNEVGGSPEAFGTTPTAFHAFHQAHADRWPAAMLATSTHDTKRSEDVRARIDVLSEIPAVWQASLRHWTKLNRRHHTTLDGDAAPDRNDEYLLYQALVGAWPLEEPDAAGYEAFVARIRDYMLKAVREAKRHTSWINADEDYEAALRKFIDAILHDVPTNKFLEDLRGFARLTAHWGLLNGLSQTLLKLTCPGVPDVYQGTELWDLSLVDPDNRRPVDFARRAALLDDLSRRVAESGEDLRPLAAELMAQVTDGRIKMYTIWRALQARRQHRSVFCGGTYRPVETAGQHAECAVAFTRQSGDAAFLVVVPRLVTRLCTPETLPLGEAAWGDTALVWPRDTDGRPPDIPGRWRNVLTGEIVSPRVGDASLWLPEGTNGLLHVAENATPADADSTLRLPLAEVFATLPIALLEAVDD